MHVQDPEPWERETPTSGYPARPVVVSGPSRVPGNMATLGNRGVVPGADAPGRARCSRSQDGFPRGRAGYPLAGVSRPRQEQPPIDQRSNRVLHFAGAHDPNVCRIGGMPWGDPVTAKLRDVAKMAGVSMSTVSRALNGDQGRSVALETRERILDVARQLKYEPNDAAQRLVRRVDSRVHRTGRVGLILGQAYKFSDPFWSR